MKPTIPETGYLRLPQIIGQTEITPEQAAINRKTGKGLKRPRPGIVPLVPVSASTWWAGVASGRFPSSVRLPGGQITVWRAEAIRTWLEANGGAAA